MIEVGRYNTEQMTHERLLADEAADREREQREDDLPLPLPRDRQIEHDRSLAAYDRALGEGRN